jgi:hypothetical protein
MVKIVNPGEGEQHYDEFKYSSLKLYIAVSGDNTHIIHKAGRTFNAYDLFNTNRTALSTSTKTLAKCVENCLLLGMQVYTFDTMPEFVDWLYGNYAE